jgi:hypothetical protein
MAEDASQTITTPQALEDSSQVAGNMTVPGDPGNIGNPDATVTPSPSPVSTPAASEDSGGTGEPGLDYHAAKAQYLQSRQNPAPAPAPVTEVTPPPQEPPAGDKLPAIKIRVTDPESLGSLHAFKEYRANGGTANLIEWAASQVTPAPTTQEPGTTATSVAAPEVQEAPVPMSSVALRSELTQVGKDLAQAMRDFDLEAMGRLQERQNELMLQLPEAMQNEAVAQVEAFQQQQNAVTEFDQKVAEYSDNARRLFGDAVIDPNSPLTQRASEILKAYELDGNPLANTPEAVLVIYTQAAADLGIQPAATAPTVLPRPVSPVPPVAPPSIIAGGDGRTQNPANRAALEPVTPDNYELHKQRLLQRRSGTAA